MSDLNMEQLQLLLADIDLDDLLMVSSVLGLDVNDLMDLMEVKK